MKKFYLFFLLPLASQAATYTQPVNILVPDNNLLHRLNRWFFRRDLREPVKQLRRIIDDVGGTCF